MRFSLSLRPILAATEDAAWARAERILAETKRAARRGRLACPAGAAAERGLAAPARGRRQRASGSTSGCGPRVAAATGAQGNTTALVGTPEQVAEALLDYYDLGVTTFLIRGFDPLEDAVDYGRELIPLVRDEVARREAARTAAE